MSEENIKKLLGQRIKQLRKNLNLTQFALGEMIDIDQRQIAYIEGGNCFPSLSTLNKFAKIFNCSMKDLFDYEYLSVKPNLRSEILNKIAALDDTQLQFYYDLLHLLEIYNLRVI